MSRCSWNRWSECRYHWRALGNAALAVYWIPLLWPAQRQQNKDCTIMSVADLGFGKSGCPIHQKGAPEGVKPPTCAPRALVGSGGLPRKFENLDTLWCIFPAFQGITSCMIECAFMTKRAPYKQRAGVRTPWTPPLEPPLNVCQKRIKRVKQINIRCDKKG